jgi:hypothetical protein
MEKDFLPFRASAKLQMQEDEKKHSTQITTVISVVEERVRFETISLLQ